MSKTIWSSASQRCTNYGHGRDRVSFLRKGAMIMMATLALLPLSAQATGGGSYDESDESFFTPEILANPADAPFFLTYRMFYDEGNGQLPGDEIEAVNRKEWSAYFRGKVADVNLNYLIYKMNLGELDKLIWTFEGKKAPTLSKQAGAIRDELTALGDKDQVLRALYYLGFAKRCEPIATRLLTEDPWNTEKLDTLRIADVQTADKLLAGSASQMNSVKDKFLQERYHFQRLRLLFYTGRNAEAQRYYTANIGAISTESSVKYRFIHTAAGAYFRDKKYGPANYLSSLVFDHFEPSRRSAYLSFRPVEDADWKESLKMAKNDREKAVLWQLLGIRADGLAAIDKIFALAPTSNLLPLLLVREVNKAEADWFTNEARARDNLGSGNQETREAGVAVGKKRIALFKRLTDGNKSDRPYLWQLSLAHLYVLSGDTKSALAYLDAADRTLPKTGVIVEQARVTRLFARVRAMRAIDKTQEPYLAAELSWLAVHKGNLRTSGIKDWTEQRLKGLYQKAGDPLRATLLVNAPPMHNQAPDIRLIDRILAFLEQPGKSEFDEYLAKKYSYDKGRMLEFKANSELYAGHFQSAADLYAQAGAKISDQPLRADPFTARIVDCHDCDHQAKHATKYTQASFVKRLIELSQKAQRNDAEGAQASMLLANGVYNMSWYGNAREFCDLPVFTDDGPIVAPHYKMDLAEKYYKRALSLPGNKEFKAKACFMVAKTEQNKFFNAENKKKGDRSPDGTVHSPIYFQKLKESYADTKYYQEIIRECSYFRDYLKR